MMEVFIARHGATEWNLKELLCGRTDLPLSGEGLGQAEALGAKLATEGIRPDRIYASPLTRAQQTAAIVAKYVHAPVVTDARLVEQNFGVFEGGFCRAPAYLECKRNLALRCPGGESAMDVACRIYPFLDELKHARDIRTALLIGHGSAWRVLSTYFEDMNNEAFFRWGMGNAELRRYTLETVE
jgi:broad specificity phosphatase PhoE